MLQSLKLPVPWAKGYEYDKQSCSLVRQAAVFDSKLCVGSMSSDCPSSAVKT